MCAKRLLFGKRITRIQIKAGSTERPPASDAIDFIDLSPRNRSVAPVDSAERHPALGIDHGDARIGVAATDPVGILAHPVETIDVRKMDPLDRIAALVAQRRAKTLVVGLPCRIDGTEGTAAEKVRAFAAKLSARLPELPLVFVDEAYTTMDAAAKLREAGRNAKRQKAVIDQAAAVAILELWMESL